MVQILKEDIAIKIFESAKREFFLNGFKGATVRDIAKGAGIPVGLVYSYYENKKTLFEKIVEPVYSTLEMLLTHDEEEHSSRERKDSSLFNELKHLLLIFEENRETFLIMIDKSEDTKYESIKDDIIKMTEKHIKINLLNKVKAENEDIDDMFFHILASNFIESIIEIGRHYKGRQWADKMLYLVAQQYFYGVNSF